MKHIILLIYAALGIQFNFQEAPEDYCLLAYCNWTKTKKQIIINPN